MTGGGTLNAGSTLTVAGTFTPGGGTVVYDGAADQTITTANVTYNNLTVDDSGATATAAANLTIGNNLTVASGTMDLSTFTATGTLGGAVLAVANGATLLVGGSANFPGNYSTYSLGASSTVNYYRAGTQTITAQTYGNLTLSGTSAKTISSGTTVNGTLLMAGSATTTGSSPTYGSAATLEYAGTGSMSTGVEFPATFVGSGGVIVNMSTVALTITLSAAKVISAALTIDNGLVNLNGVTSTASQLFFDAVQQASGTWGGSTATLVAHQSANFGTTSKTLNVLTGVSTPTISGLTSKAITYGTATVTLTGAVSATGPVYPANGEQVSVTINGSTQPATISGGVGGFSVSFATATIPVTGSPFTITYSYAGDANLSGVTDTSTTLTVSPASLTITASAQSKTYGTALSLGTTAFTTSGLLNSDSVAGVTLSSSGAAANAPVSGSPYNIVPSAATGSGLANYTITYANGQLTVNKLPVVLTGTRTYDGTSAASFSILSVGNVVAGDTVTVASGSGTLSSINVGSPTITSFGTLTLGGASANNYTLSGASGTVTITAKALSVSGLSASASKGYDGTTTASVTGTPALQSGETAGSGSAADGKPFTGDTVSLTGTAAYAYNSKDVATATTITESGLSLMGGSAPNYSLTAPTFSATITKKALTMSGLTVSASKIYDGTTTATVGGTPAFQSVQTPGSGSTADGKPYSGDTISFSGTAIGTYNSKDVLTATTVTFGGLTVGGAQGGDYSLTIQSPASATITTKALTGTGTLVFPASKVYDGSTTASPTSGSPGLAIPESPGSGTTADGKPYTGDTVSVTGSASYNYNSKDVGSATTIKAGGLSLTGATSTDYTLTTPTFASTITAKALTALGTLVFPASKIYDGTTTATPTSGSAALQAAEAVGTGTTSDGKPYTIDSVSLTGTAAYAYNSKDVASATTITESGLSLAGSVDYTLTVPTFSATITPKALNYSGLTANNKTYDGTTAGTFTGSATKLTAETGGLGSTSDGRPYTGDTVTLSAGPYSGTFASPNVGTGIAVTLTGGLTLSGAQSSDYSVGSPTVAFAANITKPVPSITGVTASQTITYGTASITLSGTVSASGPSYPAIGDTVSVLINGVEQDTTISDSTGDFSINYATASIPYSTTPYTITYEYAGDLNLSAAANNTSATLTVNQLVVTLTGTRIYDGTSTAVAPSALAISDLVPGDSVTLSGSAPLAGNDVPSQAILSNPSAVQTNTANTGSGTSGSLTVTLASTPIAGNTLIAVVSTHTSSDAITSITETGVTTWQQAGLSSSGSGTTTEIWYAPNVPGTASRTITINLSPSARAAAVVMEYRGILTASPLDQTATSTGSGTSVSVGPTPTTTQTTELWVGAIGYASSTPTLGTIIGGFGAVTSAASTSGTAGNNAKVYVLTNAVTATGAASTGGTLSSSVVWSGAIATFQAAAIPSLTISGPDSGNYTLIGATGAVFITPKALNYTGVTAANKTYDGTTAATFTGNAAKLTAETAGTGSTSDGKAYTIDTVSFSVEPYTGTFASANVGTGIAVTLTGGLTLSGAQASDYSVGSSTAAFSANITAATLTVTPNAVTTAYTGVPLNNTAYSDNTANYSITGFKHSETVASAGVTLSGSMAFNGSVSTVVQNPGTYTQSAGTLALSSANNNYVMTFANPTPNNYVITAGAASIIFFVQQPTTVQSATSISPNVTVEVTDSFGNPVSGVSVTMSINSGPGVTLSGGAAQTTSAGGIATFSALQINLIGNYTLKASISSPSLSVVSSPFAVTLGPIASYTVTTSPPSPTRGVPFNVTVTAFDAGGNQVTTDNSTSVTLTDSTGNMQFTGDPATLAGGTFTISALDNYYETDVITATDGNGNNGSDTVNLGALTGDYRSRVTGQAWSTINTWQTWNGTTWQTATAAPTSATANLISVQSNMTVTVSASVTAQLLVITAGSTVTIANGQTFTVNNGVANGTISDGSSNNGILVESGAGNSFSLFGNNSYGGGTVITGGTVVVTNLWSAAGHGNLNLGNGGITFNGGTLQDNSDVPDPPTTGNAQTFSGFVTVNSTGGTISQLGIPGDTITLTGSLTGSGTLTTGGSDLILDPSSGNNTVSAINVVSGRLFINSSAALNYTSSSGVAVTIQSGAFLDFQSGAPTPANSITFESGAAVSSRSGTLTLNTGNVHFPSAGSMIFDEDDDASENINVNGTYPTLTGPLTIQVGSINVSVGTAIFNAAINGPYGINKTSTSTLELSAANTYTGGTTVSGGTLDAHVAGSLSSGDVLVVAGATNQLDVSTAMGSSSRLLLASQTTSIVRLANGISDSIGGLSFDGGATYQANGTWGGTSSGATHKLSPPFATGLTGTLTVGSPRAITVTAASNTKVYDGTTSAAATPTITSGSLATDDSAALTEAYSTKDAGTGKTLIPAAVITDSLGITVNGDYTITLANNFTGVITAKALNYTGVTANNKVYDSTTTATFTGSAVTLIAETPGTGTTSDGEAYTGDTVSFSAGPYTGTFASANIGSGITVTLSGGLTLSGSQASDYSIGSSTIALAAKITTRPLTITANDQSKTYGQTLTFGSGSALFVSSGLQGGQTVGSVTLACSGGAANAPVSGSPYTITPSAATGGTFTPGNYSISYNNGTLTVSQLAVILTGTRAWDGTAVAQASILTIVNNIDGANLTLSGSATLASASTGTEPITSFAGLTLGGSASGNYTLTLASGSVSINPSGNPVANPASYSRAKNTQLLININNLLSTDTSDPSGDPVGLLLVDGQPLVDNTVIDTTTNGSSIFYASSHGGVPVLLLTAVNNKSETFTYEVVDTSFATFTASSTVTINVASATGQATASIVVVGGQVTTTWAGIPGDSYVVQVSSTISGPWTDVSGTLTAPSGGVFSYTDINPPTPMAFYQLRQN
jgi:autotransporter-associated beta strand protein